MFTLTELDAAESEARRVIERILAPLLELAEQTRLLLYLALESVAQHPLWGPSSEPASKVCMILAVRLANDLRACSILCRSGYGLQAMGLAATSVELAGALAYVSDNEERAFEWAKHSAKKQSFPQKVTDGIDALADGLGLVGSRATEMKDRWRRIYMSLCMAKHANPILSMNNGLRFDSDGAYFGAGPDASRIGIHLSLNAVYQAIFFSLEGLVIYAHSCNDISYREKLLDQAKETMRQVRRAELALADFVDLSSLDDE